MCAAPPARARRWHGALRATPWPGVYQGRPTPGAGTSGSRVAGSGRTRQVGLREKWLYFSYPLGLEKMPSPCVFRTPRLLCARFSGPARASLVVHEADALALILEEPAEV